MINTTNARQGSELSDIANFVSEVARTLQPQTDHSISRLTLVLGKFVSWAQNVRGLPLAEKLLFDSQVIDLYIRDAVREKKLAKSSVATYRSVLLRASEVYLPRHDAAPAREVGATSLLLPYTPKEIESFPTWARGQRTELMRQKGLALISLGLGCGLRAREINALKRRSVTDQGTDGVSVVVTNDRGTRIVPMLPRYHGAIRQVIADRVGDDFVFGQPVRAINPNALGEFISSSGHGHVKPNTYRMRSTWLIGRLRANVDIPTVLEAADLDRLEKLNDYLPYLQKPNGVSRALLTKEAR